MKGCLVSCHLQADGPVGDTKRRGLPIGYCSFMLHIYVCVNVYISPWKFAPTRQPVRFEYLLHHMIKIFIFPLLL